MGVKEDEEIDGAVAAILVVEALGPSRRGRDRLARFADELGGAFVEADHRRICTHCGRRGPGASV